MGRDEDNGDPYRGMVMTGLGVMKEDGVTQVVARNNPGKPDTWATLVLG